MAAKTRKKQPRRLKPRTGGKALRLWLRVGVVNDPLAYEDIHSAADTLVDLGIRGPIYSKLTHGFTCAGYEGRNCIELFWAVTHDSDTRCELTDVQWRELIVRIGEAG